MISSREFCLVVAGFMALLVGCAPSNQSAPVSAVSPSPPPSPSEKITSVEIAPLSLDVPYVPTPHEVVARMLAIANVNRKDVLYDLGSGDGRILITAAQRYGSRGIGYEIDSKRIEEANENARVAGVTERVRFIKQNLFEADLSEATVVTLYLLPEVNLKLRPKLLRELKPGTRIVSHNYGMGDWDPIKTERLDTAKGEHLIFYWVVPAKGVK